MSKQGCLRTILALGALLLLAMAVLGLAYWQFLVPFKGYPADVFIELEHGTSTTDIARELEDKGIIRSRYAFLLWRALHTGAALQAGEYHFDRPLTPGEVFDRIRRGLTYYEELIVPEGSNSFDIAALLKALRSAPSGDFLKEASDPTLIRDLDPTAPTLEGYLFPSTYRVTRKTTAAQLCQSMTAEFRRQWQLITAGQPAPDVHRTVTLASLVEKETAVPLERPLIAAVFINRLRLDMPLQCDPTVVYAAVRKNAYRGAIYRSDLSSTDPYNTYNHPGLPPGAIANPGTESLKAALHPEPADYLYFVAKPGSSGHHTFSSTLNEHEAAVHAYRQGH